MKRTDLTLPGGFPFDQNRLKWMLDGLNETVVALAMRGYDGVRPYVVYGCALTRSWTGGTTYNYAIAAGWVFYAGELIEVEACNLAGVDESVNDCYAVITSQVGTYTYYDTSSQNAELRKVVVSLAAHAVGTAGDATKFAVLKHLLRKEWQVVGDTAAAITLYAGTFIPDLASPIKYRLDVFDNSVTIVGVTNDPGSSVAVNTVIFTLPTGHRPAEEQLYLVLADIGSSLNGVVRVKTNGDVCIAGDVLTQSTVGVWLNIRVALG